MKTLLAVTLCALLAGCPSSGTREQAQVIDGLCASSSAAVKLLAVARDEGKLSETTIANVDFARTIVQPICDAPLRPTLDSLGMQAFTRAISTLTEAAHESR